MAKAKRRRLPQTVPVATVLGLVPGFLFPFGKSHFDRAQQGDWQGIADSTLAAYTGFSFVQGNWDANRLAQGFLPAAVGSLVSLVLGKMLGINRRLARARIPYFRL